MSILKNVILKKFACYKLVLSKLYHLIPAAKGLQSLETQAWFTFKSFAGIARWIKSVKKEISPTKHSYADKSPSTNTIILAKKPVNLGSTGISYSEQRTLASLSCLY